MGRRIEKAVTENSITTTTRYLYDGFTIVAEYDENNNVKAQYIHNLGIDDQLAMVKNGQTYFYHKDGLGNVVALTDGTGTIVQTYAYDSFGNITNQTGAINQPYTFTGREYDPESGLYYLRARELDSKTGTFTQKDPIGFAGGDVNLYRYVGNNPVNAIDPLGLETYSCYAPLHALGKFGELIFNPAANQYYHQYLCVKVGDKTVCGGQDRSGGPWSPGKPSEGDYFNKNRCVETKPSCNIDECVKKAINDPKRPYYGLKGLGTNCQEWAIDVYLKCAKQCQTGK